MRIGAAVVMVTLAVAASARASPSTRLVYTRSADAMACPDEASLRAAVATRFGYDPFFPWAKGAVVVQVWREHGRLNARVQLVDEQGIDRGTRQITSDRDGCASLFDATALAISIALDAADPVASPPVAPAPAPSSDVPAFVRIPKHLLRPPRPHSTPTRLVRHRRSPPSGGSAPTPSWRVGRPRPGHRGSRCSRGRAAGSGRIQVEAMGDLSTRSTQGSADAIVQSSVFAGAVVACAHLGPAFACPLGEIGSLVVWGEGGRQPHTQDRLFAASGGRIGLEWPLSRAVTVHLRGDALLINPPRVFPVRWSDKAGVVHLAPHVRLRGGLLDVFPGKEVARGPNGGSVRERAAGKARLGRHLRRAVRLRMEHVAPTRRARSRDRKTSVTTCFSACMRALPTTTRRGRSVLGSSGSPTAWPPITDAWRDTASN